MEMMQVETMSAFACHVTAPRLTAILVVGLFFLLLLHVADGMETNPSLRPRPAQHLGLDGGPAFFQRLVTGW
jgi:hypothetical protein